MDTRLLRFFIAVYELKNLTRAAEKCFVSQPNISSGIKQIEELVGSQLFIRNKKGVESTNSGHQLYPIAKRLLGELNELPQMFQTPEYTQTIKLGITESLPQRLKQKFFQIANELCKSTLWEISDIHRDNEINLLVREFKYEEDLFLPLWKERYVLCIPDGHPLQNKDKIHIEDLTDEPFIHCPPCEAHQQCLSILNTQTRISNVVANCSTKTETLTLLMAGLGITFLPEYFAEGWHGFTIREYKGPQYYREVGLAYHRKSLQNNSIKTIIDFFSNNQLIA